MDRSWKRNVATAIVILGLCFCVQETSSAGQGDQDQQTRIHQKMEKLQAAVGQTPCVNMQALSELMHGLEPLLQQHKLAEAEALLDHALDLVNKPPPRVETGPPASLQQKMHRLQVLVQKRQQAGGDMQPMANLMQDFQPLMERQKYREAEAVLDRVLAFLNGTAPPGNANKSEEAPLIAYGACDAYGKQQIFANFPDGSGKRQLTQEGNRNFFPAWSPDGERLAYTSDRSGSLQIWVMDADGNHAEELTTSFEGENDVPTWSPDGRKLAFGSDRTGHVEIWAMDADGNHQKQLTKTDPSVGNNAAAWSPDGKKIAFSSTRSGHPAIWTMDPDGRHLTQLTTPFGGRYPDANAPAWSPDGTKIAFWSGLEHQYGNVWVMNADGSNRKQLTDQPAGINCDEAAWSADGREIMFASNRPGSDGIGNWIMDADGNSQKVFIPDTNVRGRAAWQPPSNKH